MGSGKKEIFKTTEVLRSAIFGYDLLFGFDLDEIKQQPRLVPVISLISLVSPSWHAQFKGFHIQCFLQLCMLKLLRLVGNTLLRFSGIRFQVLLEPNPPVCS
ncbi:hypothetical protein V6N13_087233 [Hibiscus sabdariffa]